MDAIEYLDEDLPEIEIREIVSSEDFYEYTREQKKGINILDPADVLFYLTMFLQSKQRAKGFLQLHQEILTEETFSLPLPEVHLQRIDAGDEDAFFTAFDEANKIDNYFTRQQELHKVFLGFETTQETNPQLELHPTKPTPVILLQQNSQTHLLPSDNLHPTIQSYHPRTGIPPTAPAFRSLTMADKITEQTLFQTPQAPLLTELTDLYTLWKNFMRINQEVDYPALQEQLLQLKEADQSIYQFLTQTSSTPIPLYQEETGGQAFYSIQRQIFLTLQPILEQLQKQLLTLYQAFLQSLSTNLLSPEQLPTNAYDLIQEILNDQRSIPDTINLLKLHMLKQQQQNIQTWLKQVTDWNPQAIQEKVTTNYYNYQKTATSIQDEPYIRWTSIDTHIQQISKGEIISKSIEEAFLPTQLPTDDMLLEKDDPNEITLPIFEEPTELTLPTEHLNEGQKELFTISYRLLYTLHKATGLPLDLHQFTLQVPDYYRKTKLTLIQEQLPELTPDLQLIASRLDPDQINSVTEAPTVRATLQFIYQSFLHDLHHQLHYLLAGWICELQRHVLNRTLNFEIWKGAANCIPAWSPYGMPMENVRKREGILPYMQCVIEDLVQLEGTSWYTYYLPNQDLTDKLQPFFQKEFAPQVETLQADFKSFDKELPLKNLKAKGLAIKEDLESTVKKREKAKYLQEYMKFLKNLPSVLIQSSIAKRIYSGCCLQLLSEKYASDYDWSAYVKDAYKLKKLFATQKMEKAPRLTQYATPLPPITTIKTPIISNAAYLQAPPLEKWTLENWSNQMTVPPPTDIKAATDKNLSIYNRSIKNTLLAPFLTNANAQNLIEFYRKILQSQYQILSEIENPTEKTFLQREMNKLHPLHDLLLTTTDYYNDVQDMYRKRILQYFCSQQVCFPARPELARNNTLVLSEDGISSSFLGAYLQAVYDKLAPWITEKQFNQSTNFQAYIAKMREQENNAKLRIIDKMNPEERKLYVEAKKLGIFELREYLAQFQREPEQEGEEYVDPGENNDEADMDNLYDDIV